jgi:hypothetical protein
MPIVTTTTTARTRRSSLPVTGDVTVWRDKTTDAITTVTIWTKNHEGKDIVVDISGYVLQHLVRQIKGA